jgi:hypothetical protein
MTYTGRCRRRETSGAPFLMRDDVGQFAVGLKQLACALGGRRTIRSAAARDRACFTRDTQGRLGLVIEKIAWLVARVIFAGWYFGVGIVGFITNNPTRDAAEATTSLEKAMAQSLFMNPLLCLCCLVGGGALFFRRTTPLGIVTLAPLVIIIFFFHVMITKSFGWGALNLAWLGALAWRYRRGFDQLWNYQEPGRGRLL